jgi:diketogulonate reductase-like aldo/keto reductase
MLTRLIPSSGESLPAIGLGTWIQFDVGNANEERSPLKEVLTLMLQQGGTVIDSSPMYGKSEQVVGDLTRETGTADSFFYATKVWTSGEKEGKRQIQESFQKLRRPVIDLMQIHNLLDWQIHLRSLRKLKEEGKIRYIGITHYTNSAHPQLEEVIKNEKLDFVQFNYSIIRRNAERSLLQTAHDRGVAVLINEPFEKGSLFKLVSGHALPEWTAEYDIKSWSQFFLKFILSHPAVTCVIPGTSDPKNIADNMAAGSGQLPDEVTRKKMIQVIENF